MKSDAQRFREALTVLNLSANALMVKLGYGKQTQKAYFILSERNGMSKDFAEEINLNFPQISAKYLYEGVGELLTSFQAPEFTGDEIYYTMPDNSMFPFIIKGDVLVCIKDINPIINNFYLVFSEDNLSVVREFSDNVFKAKNPDYPIVKDYKEIARVVSLKRSY